MRAAGLSALAVFTLLALAVPARAETVTLVCKVGQQSWIVDIDFDNALVADRPSWQSPEQTRPERAEITPSTIRWRCNHIDRQTGDIFFCEGHGTCQRASKPLL